MGLGSKETTTPAISVILCLYHIIQNVEGEIYSHKQNNICYAPKLPLECTEQPTIHPQQRCRLQGLLETPTVCMIEKFQ